MIINIFARAGCTTRPPHTASLLTVGEVRDKFDEALVFRLYLLLQ